MIKNRCGPDSPYYVPGNSLLLTYLQVSFICIMFSDKADTVAAA